MSPKLDAGSAMTEGRRRHVPPRQADAEQVCSLDEETTQRRKEPPEAFLAAARSKLTLPNGGEFHFEAKAGMWERVTTFIEEEGECCPFFAFDQWEEGDEVVLRIIRPDGNTE